MVSRCEACDGCSVRPVEDICECVLARGGGVISCAEHLGVFVSKPVNDHDCPAGWAFVNIDDTTVEQLREAVAHTKKGRSTWPERTTF